MGWKGLGDFLKETKLITKIIATVRTQIVLMTILSILVTLDTDPIVVIAILSGIAGSAATFLFAPRLGKE